MKVSIHAPRVGCDFFTISVSNLFRGFNSRTPCGVRLTVDAHQGCEPTVSIHAPRVGCDIDTLLQSLIKLTFQFTHPVWGATYRLELLLDRETVSIHAPRVGCDILTIKRYRLMARFNSRTPCGVRHGISSPISKLDRFNSRTPCGVRLIYIHITIKITAFQFTHPVWGATRAWVCLLLAKSVSIHAPRVGCDPESIFTGETLASVSIHAPRVGCDTNI